MSKNKGFLKWLKKIISKNQNDDGLYDDDGRPYAIVRSYYAGVICGYVDPPEGPTGTMVKVHNARQMYQWDGHFVLADLAEYGPRKIEQNRFSTSMNRPLVALEACAILYCSKAAAENIIAIPDEYHE